jgi:hypothetical protein
MSAMRWNRPWLLWGCALLLLVPGCKQGKSYPTAPAPKSIQAPPPPEPMAAMATEEDEDDDAPASMQPQARSDEPSGEGDPSPPARAGDPGAGDRPATINGHPEGPKAEVFNAVMNNAFGAAARCLTGPAATGDGPSALQVQVEVGPSGQVEKAEVQGGAENPSLRACVVGVVKGLTFPPFKGPKVVQTVPFSFYRQPDAPPQ